jgi:hypothetical protein
MKRAPFSQRVVAAIVFSGRQPGRDDFRDVVQFQMPNEVMRLIRAEARHRGTDVSTLMSDVVCEALTERARAIRGAAAPADHRHE